MNADKSLAFNRRLSVFIGGHELTVLSRSMLSDIEQRHFKKWFAFKE
jgi:hypothetical protein